MTYRGRVKKGVVVFDEPVSLEEDTPVSIQPLSEKALRSAVRGSPESIRRCKARWVGDPSELDRLLDEVQRLRDADLTPAGDS